MDAYIGTILPWAPSYAPYGWALCNGQDMPINQYQALYALLGNIYGPASTTTFKLPNLCGRVPVGAGNFSNNGSSFYFQQGQSNGLMQTFLSAAQTPVAPHNHTITSTATVTPGAAGTASVEVKIPINTDNQPSPMPTPATYTNTPSTASTLGQAKQGNMNVNMYTTNPPTAGVNLKSFTATGTSTASAPTVSVASVCAQGGAVASQAVSLMQPYLVIQYIICLQGIWPERP